LSAVVTAATQPEKPVTVIGKKRDVQTSVISTPERHNHVDNGQDRSRQRVEVATNVDDRETKKDAAFHAAKRKKLARNEKLIGNDDFEVTDRKPTPTTDTSGVDRKLISTAETPERSVISSKSASDDVHVPSPTAVETPRNDIDSVLETVTVGHVTSKNDDIDPEVVSLTTTGSRSVAEKVEDKDRADILDDIDDDVNDTFALFAQIKSTSGAGLTEDNKELPVSQAQQQSQVTSRTDSYDQLSTGGAAITMVDSGYQTYDHDLSALNDRPSQAVTIDNLGSTKLEVASELEVQSSISEPDIADTVARYSASSDSEISVELPSCASSSGADKPTTFDWQLPPATHHDVTETTHYENSHADDVTQTRKVVRRASEEDLEQIRSSPTLHLTFNLF